MYGLFDFIKSNLRWLLGGLLLTLFSSFGQTFFIAQFNKPIREAFGLTDGQYGMLYMGATLASAATLVLAGRALDRFPVSNVALLVILCLSVACVGMSFAKLSTIVWPGNDDAHLADCDGQVVFGSTGQGDFVDFARAPDR